MKSNNKTRGEVVCELCDDAEFWMILGDCVLCKRSFCASCIGDAVNPFRIDVCKICLERQDVREIMHASLSSYCKVKTFVINRIEKLLEVGG